MPFWLFAFNMHANSQWIPHAGDIMYKSALSLVVSNLGRFKNEYFEEIHIIKCICSIFHLWRKACSPFSTGKVDPLPSHSLLKEGGPDANGCNGCASLFCERCGLGGVGGGLH